jgi:azurin
MRVRVVLFTAAIAAASYGVSLAQTPAPAKPAPAKPAPAPAKKAPAKAPRVVEITADDMMKFSLTAIPASRGERLTVRLINKGKMTKLTAGHNFVLLAKGTDIPAFAGEAATASATDFIPAKLKSKVLAATKLSGGGETVEVTFTVPATAGAYPFICSFPGHYALMKGTLDVK